jgi:hypothetical protein
LKAQSKGLVAIGAGEKPQTAISGQRSLHLNANYQAKKNTTPNSAKPSEVVVFGYTKRVPGYFKRVPKTCSAG